MNANPDDLTIAQTTYTTLPTGEYKAVLTDIKRETSRFLDEEGNPKDQLVLSFEIVDERFDADGQPLAGRQLRAWANPSFTATGPKGPSKLYAWTSALLGRHIAQGEAFQASRIVGRRCILSVIRQQNGDKAFSKVAAVLADPDAEPAAPVERPAVTTVALPLPLGSEA